MPYVNWGHDCTKYLFGTLHCILAEIVFQGTGNVFCETEVLPTFCGVHVLCNIVLVLIYNEPIALQFHV